MSEKNDATTLKSLDYYLEHPDEMPTDPEAIAKIMDAAGGGEEDKVEPSKETKEGDGTKTEEKKGEPAPASAGKPDDTKVDGVIAKDGKHFLPYQEMERRIEAARQQGGESARQAAETAAKETVEKLQNELAQRDAKVKELEKGGKGEKVVDPIEGIPAELLETFRTEYPSHAKIIEPLIAGIKQRDERIKELTTAVQETRESQQKTDAEIAAEEVQALIEANADLASWQKERPTLFDLAIDTEAKLMGDKAWVKDHQELVKDDGKRYEHVVTLVKQAVGLPAASPKNDDNADLDRKAEEALADAKSATPRSLSDIKGGAAPATSVEENLEGASTEDLAAHLLKMTPEQRERWYARLG